VVDGVSQQVYQRIAQLVEDLPIELDLFALDRNATSFPSCRATSAPAVESDRTPATPASCAPE